MRKLSAFGLIIVSAVLVSGIAFTQNGQPLAQAPAAAAVVTIPNVVGNWSFQSEEVGFHYPLDAIDEAPNFDVTSSQGAAVIFITAQQGRTFAGYVMAQTGQHDKLTGAIMEDGTITVQLVTVFNQSTPNRGLLWGKVSPLRRPTAITAIANGFEELSSGASSSFASGYYKLTKVH
jgi:hypothetical protein